MTKDYYSFKQTEDTVFESINKTRKIEYSSEHILNELEFKCLGNRLVSFKGGVKIKSIYVQEHKYYIFGGYELVNDYIFTVKMIEIEPVGKEWVKDEY